MTFVSVVIPTKNSEKTIVECLKSLKNQSYPKNKYEVIIADDHSGDKTVELAKKHGAKVITSHGPPGKQRNKGISIAKGEVIGLIDSDCKAMRGWISRGVKHFTSDGIGVVGGPNLTPKNDPFLSHCTGYALSSKIGSGTMSVRYVKDGFVPKEADETSLISCNMFVKKEAIKKAGGFNEDMFPGEENELMFRIKGIGYKLLYVPNLKVWHHRRSSIKRFFLQTLAYGRSRAEFVRKHPSALKLIHLLPSIFVLGILIGPIFFSFFSTVKMLYILAITLYVSFVLLSSIKKTVEKKDIRLMIILPLLFFLIHTSYGIGFLKGMIKSD